MRNKSQNIKAVIFDMDGVIINSTPVHFKAWREFLSKYGVSYSFKEFEKIIGLPTKDIMIKLRNKYGIKGNIERMIQEKNNLYLNYFSKEVFLLNGVLQLLKRLKKEGLLIAIASSEPRKIIKTMIRTFKLQRYFKCYFGVDDIIHPKPNPELFIKIASKLNIFSNQCLVIEDSPSGITAAKSAKMKCAAITTTHRYKDLKGADFIIDEFSELNKILNQ